MLSSYQFPSLIGDLVSALDGLHGGTGSISYPQTLFPRSEIKEDKDVFSVVLPLPGVGKENIDVTLDGDVLRISARNKGSNEKDFREVLAYKLPGSCDPTKATVSYVDGILRATIPKISRDKATKSIPIK